MAAFASDRRSGWVRVLVLILCALFIFAVVATPPAFAISETVALFTAASVLSAAVAALGFKLSSDAEGQATLNQMVKDFAAVSWAIGLVAVGDKVNGLLNGVQYIKMQVLNGKTYLDQRIVAWCQQWLGTHGVYDVSSSFDSSFSSGSPLTSYDFNLVNPLSVPEWANIISVYTGSYAPDWSKGFCWFHVNNYTENILEFYVAFNDFPKTFSYQIRDDTFTTLYDHYIQITYSPNSKFENQYVFRYSQSDGRWYFNRSTSGFYNTFGSYPLEIYDTVPGFPGYQYICNLGTLVSSPNDTGLSGTDTIGADYKDKTLDQILDGLKDWAQDWYDAGADSATNTVAGAKDLPLTVGEQAASANPALNPDVVYNPPFALPLPDVRSGETTAGTITAGQENASAAETATADVAENQSVINSLVSWALNYIDPDTGLFSKFPLCVPYDAYLLVTSSLGVDAVGSDSIFGASPGDLDGVVTESIDTYSDFQPIINIDHDFELDGKTYPISISIDLSPWQPLVTFFREGMALLLVAELIGSEYKRIRGH